MGDSRISVYVDIRMGCGVVGDDVGTDEIVDNRGVTGTIEMGMFNPRPAAEDRLSRVSLAIAEPAAAMLVALNRSASATFSAVNSGTAGIGLDGAEDFPNVMILGCARTCTGTGAAVIMAVERYAFVAMEARVYVVPMESRLE